VRFLCLGLAIVGASCAQSETATTDADVFADAGPPFVWSTATPESQGLSGARLDAMQKTLASHKTTGLLILRNDQIVHEWYASGWSASKTHYTASMAKALVGGVSTALALGDGRLALTDLASIYVPQWKTGVHAPIRVWQLGTHTAGIEDSEPKDTPGWKSDFWARKSPPDDPFTLARDKAPVIATPGTKQIYSNPSLAMLSYVVTAALEGSPQPDLRTLLEQRVMQPIGVPDAEWNVGYNQTFTLDGLPMVPCWGGGNFTARAAARVGRLMLRQGSWDGQQLIPASAVQAVTGAHPQAPAGAFAPGIGWWSNATGWLSLPRDTFAGLGAGHQVLLVVPSLNLIVVRHGGDLASDFDQAIEDYLARPLMAALLP